MCVFRRLHQCLHVAGTRNVFVDWMDGWTDGQMDQRNKCSLTACFAECIRGPQSGWGWGAGRELRGGWVCTACRRARAGPQQEDWGVGGAGPRPLVSQGVEVQ